jgi:hypothetical protein
VAVALFVVENYYNSQRGAYARRIFWSIGGRSMMTHGSISRLLTVALMIVFQASAVVTLGFSQDSSDCECDGGSWVQDDMRCYDTEENATTFCSDANYNCRGSKPMQVCCTAIGVETVIGSRCSNPPWPEGFQQLGSRIVQIQFCPIYTIPACTLAEVVDVKLNAEVCTVTMRCQESGRIASRTRIRPTGIKDFRIETRPLDPQSCCPRPGIIIGVEIMT